MKSRYLRNSTAMALALAMSLQPLSTVSYAQEKPVDCGADQEGCQTEKGGDKKEKQGGKENAPRSQQEAPPEAAPNGGKAGKEAPAAQPADQSPAGQQPSTEPPAPVTAPAEGAAPQKTSPEKAVPAKKVPEQAAPAEKAPAEAAPAKAAPAEVAPAQEVPAEAAPAEKAPVEVVPAPVEVAPSAEEASPKKAPGKKAPAEKAPPAKKAPAEAEPEAEEAAPPAPEAPAAEEPVKKLPAGKPSTGKPAAETAVPVRKAPVEEDPAEVPAEQPQEKPAVEDAAPVKKLPAEKPAAEEAVPSGETSVEETPPSQATTTPQKATEAEQQPEGGTRVEQKQDARQPDKELVEQPGEPIKTQSTAETLEPAAVVSDDITAQQQADLKVREERRREDARDHRLELLGAAAVGVAIGALVPALGGRVVEDQGDRIIVERNGEYFVRKDESSLLRYDEADFRAERLSHGRTRETVTRRDGTRIVTIRDAGGYVLYRSRILPDGREYVLIDNLRFDRRAPDYDVPHYRVDLPRDRYIVPAGRVGYDDIYQTFAAPPVVALEHPYSLQQVREDERIRGLVRRVDLDTITFDTGSAVVRQSQVPYLEDIARASIALIEQDPSAVLLIEGHTDAVGSEVYNLALSDRRAETVARILSQVYDVPPENMVVQGYGEAYLKVETQGAEERNRRVTIRNITPLLSAGTR